MTGKKKDRVVGGKLYVGMTEKQFKDLTEKKCKKCGHLEDDHFLPVNTAKSKKNNTYTCRYCGCKIK